MELELAAGKAEAALPLAERMLDLAVTTDDVFQLPSAHASVGQAALMAAGLTKADEHLAAAVAYETETRAIDGGTALLAEVQILRAAVAAANGNHSDATSLWKAGAAFFADHGYPIPPSTQRIVHLHLGPTVTGVADRG